MEGKNDRFMTLRLKAEWTQQELAEKVELSQSMIAQIEAGKKDPSRKYKLRLAKLFGVSVEWLFYEQWTDDVNVKKNNYWEGDRENVISNEARLSTHS